MPPNPIDMDSKLKKSVSRIGHKEGVGIKGGKEQVNHEGSDPSGSEHGQEEFDHGYEV
jgi:hypothetical protein